MANSQDLQISIPIAPADQAQVETAILKLNKTDPHLMDAIRFRHGTLLLNAYDVWDVLVSVRAHLGRLVFERIKKEAIAVIERTMASEENSDHVLKNLMNAVDLIKNLEFNDPSKNDNGSTEQPLLRMQILD